MDQAMRDCSYAHPYERKGEYFASHKVSGSGSCSAFLERRLPSKADGQKTAAKVRVADLDETASVIGWLMSIDFFARLIVRCGLAARVIGRWRVVSDT